MPIVKGYYNINNGVFLGLMTATNSETGVASTPRYNNGVCFGEYNTDTGEFVAETNPMASSGTIYFDEDIDTFTKGGYKQSVSGIYEDKGADIARKNITGYYTGATPNVVTKNSNRETIDYIPRSKPITPQVPSEKIKTTKQFPNEVPEHQKVDLTVFDNIDFNNLF